MQQGPGTHRYHYYAGTGLGDRAQNTYIVGVPAANIGGWEDVPCTLAVSSVYYLCEFAGA
jgi:hypothetical protein